MKYVNGSISCDTSHVRHLLDKAFPPSSLSSEDHLRLGRYLTPRILVQAYNRGKLANEGCSDNPSNDPRSLIREYEGYQNYRVAELDGTAPITEAIGDYELPFPIDVCISTKSNLQNSPASIAQNYALAICGLLPDVVEPNTRNSETPVFILCVDGVDLVDSDSSLGALCELVRLGVVSILYCDSPQLEHVGIKQRVPRERLGVRPRGKTIWNADVPDHVMHLNEAITQAIDRDTFINKVADVLSPIFGSSYVAPPYREISPQEEKQAITRLIDIITCGRMSIREEIFNSQNLHSCQEVIESCPMRKFISNQVAFAEYRDVSAPASIGLTSEEFKTLENIAICWKKVVLSDMPDQTWDDKNAPCTIVKYDQQKLADLASKYKMNTYIAAIMQQVPLKDLMLDDIEKQNQERWNGRDRKMPAFL